MLTAVSPPVNEKAELALGQGRLLRVFHIAAKNSDRDTLEKLSRQTFVCV